MLTFVIQENIPKRYVRPVQQDFMFFPDSCNEYVAVGDGNVRQMTCYVSVISKTYLSHTD